MKVRIDWFITRICDQAKFCRFCYAPWNFFPPDVPVEQALRMCDRLKALGTESVTICGGEPLLYLGLDLVVKKLWMLGIKVVLYTSGTSDMYSVEPFFPFIDFLSVPIDGVRSELIAQMRGSSQFERVNEIVSVVRASAQRPRLKVGTVVTRLNIDDVPHVGDFLRALGLVAVWRLYEFSPYGIGKHNERRYLLQPGEFAQAVAAEKARHERSGSKMLIAERSRDENEGYCMIIDSGGSFYRYAERYIPLGVTIDNTLEEILTGYDLELHERQKAWHA